MRDPLVILTYPGHFLLTGITIKSYFEFNTSRPVIVLLDDLSTLAWPTYVADAQKMYLSLNDDITFVQTSKLPEAHLFKQNNWVRQQIVKLYLNQLITHRSWLFSDGDIEYCCEVPTNKVPFTIVKPNTYTQLQQNRYVSQILKIEHPGIFTSHPNMDWEPNKHYYQVCLSNPPWRWMNSVTLCQLQEYVKECHNLTLAELHLRLTKDQTVLVTEWELIANFEQYILKNPNDLIYYPTKAITDKLVDTTPVNFCKTCYCTDFAFGKEWFIAKGVTPSDQVWQTISSISC